MNTNAFDFNFELCSYKDSLRSFAMSFTHNADDADDLVQETMLKAIRYAARFKDGTNLKGWLYMILKNTFINYYRRNIRIKNFMVNQVDVSLDAMDSGATHNQGVNKCVMDDINRALNLLQPQYVIPFLRYFEGYKYHEIAIELAIPIGTVKTRIHIARSILKKNLKMYEDKVFSNE